MISISGIPPRVNTGTVKKYERRVERKETVNNPEFPYRYKPSVAEQQFIEYDRNGKVKKIEETRERYFSERV